MRAGNSPLRFAFAACFALALNVPASAADDPVARGRYLARLGDCHICHTVPDGDGIADYAGGYALHAYFGTVYSSNLTPDKATGIGDWTPAQFYHAMHEGAAADGSYLYPAFPYPYFRHIARADSDALFAYLKTLKPVSYKPPPNRLIFPGDIRAMLLGWNLLFRDVPPMPMDKTKPAEWNRGSEIVNGLGHCSDCHTAKNFFFSDETSRYMQGGLIDDWFAADLTNAPRGGLGAWTRDDVVQYLKTGRNRFGRVIGSMQDVVAQSTSQMTDADIEAIAVYLKSLPQRVEDAPAKPDALVMAEGEAVYSERCAFCHNEKGTDYPSLFRNTLVQSRDASSVLRIILQGSEAVQTANAPVSFSMPAFPGLSDDELASVATYIRNANGNSAAAVSVAEAASFRKGLPPRD